MEQTAALFQGIATLLWPIIVIAVIYLFRPAVEAIIESARSRKFTLKIGGQELTMEEANEQQRTLIVDLQAQLVELRKKVDGVEAPSSAPMTTIDMQIPPSILWVDDQPKNNSYFVEQLSNLGISVDLALSTSEGMAKFGRGGYRAVISDMGRTEDGVYNPDAGIDLLEGIRKSNADVPFFIFSTSRAVREFGEKANALGVTGITSSPTELFGLLNLEKAKSRR